MDSKRHSTRTIQAHILATQFALNCGATCLCGAAWAGGWSHDGTDGAVIMVALPGGQATLARDGADRQARSITYVPTNGATTTITRDYGPSGHKAVEVENGTLRRHVYGAGLSPLLRVEGDGSLNYQVGMDTVSVDGTGSTTVAHLVTDIKQSTVAVLDAQGQQRQQVAYGTLGQSTSKQNSAGVYATAVQLSGYEGLSAWQLGTDQLIDNRARVYFPLAGRFLALDMAGKARSYEARGNNWITRTDFDGYMDWLVDAVDRNRRLGVIFGEDHKDFGGIILLHTFVTELMARKIAFKIFIEGDTLLSTDLKPNSRLTELKLDGFFKDLLENNRLHFLERPIPDMKLEEGEEKLIRDQLQQQNALVAEDMKDYKFRFARSFAWDIRRPMLHAKKENVYGDGKSSVAIFFTGGMHLQALPNTEQYYYQRQADGIRYKHTIVEEKRLSYLQPDAVYDLVFQYTLLGINPFADRFGRRVFADIDVPHLEKVQFLPMQAWNEKDMKYVTFASFDILAVDPQLRKPFGLDDKDDEKSEAEKDGALAKEQEKPLIGQVADEKLGHGRSGDEVDLMDKMKGGGFCKSCCIVQ